MSLYFFLFCFVKFHKGKCDSKLSLEIIEENSVSIYGLVKKGNNSDYVIKYNPLMTLNQKSKFVKSL